MPTRAGNTPSATPRLPSRRKLAKRVSLFPDDALVPLPVPGNRRSGALPRLLGASPSRCDLPLDSRSSAGHMIPGQTMWVSAMSARILLPGATGCSLTRKATSARRAARSAVGGAPRRPSLHHHCRSPEASRTTAESRPAPSRLSLIPTPPPSGARWAGGGRQVTRKRDQPMSDNVP